MLLPLFDAPITNVRLLCVVFVQILLSNKINTCCSRCLLCITNLSFAWFSFKFSSVTKPTLASSAKTVRSFSDTFLNFFLHKLTQFVYYIKQITFTQTYIKSKLKLIQSNKLHTHFSGDFNKIYSNSVQPPHLQLSACNGTYFCIYIFDIYYIKQITFTQTYI